MTRALLTLAWLDLIVGFLLLVLVTIHVALGTASWPHLLMGGLGLLNVFLGVRGLRDKPEQTSKKEAPSGLRHRG